MYCFQCGEELVEGAKFCHICGANQEESRKLFEKRFKKSSPERDVQSDRGGSDTKVAYSSDPDDGAYLKSYLNKVDTNVGESIKRHETMSGLQKESKQSTVNAAADTPKDREKPAAPDTPKKKKDLITPSHDSTDEKSIKKKTRFSDIWHRFIDEEDNPYSVFGEMADRLEKDQHAIASEEEDKLRVSQDLSDDRLAQTGDVSTLNKKVNEILDEQEKPTNKKPLTAKVILSSFFSKNKEKDKSNNTDQLLEPMDSDKELRQQAKLFEDKQTAPSRNSEKIFPADSNETLHHQQSSAKASKDDTNTLPIDVEETDTKKSKPQKTNKVKKNRRLFSQKNTKSSEKNTGHVLDAEQRTENLVARFPIEGAALKLDSLRERILNKGAQGIRGLYGIGILISALPVFFAFRKFSLLPIVFIVLKIAINLFTFFFANRIARRNTCPEDSDHARLVDSLIHWILYLIPMTIVFFILPSSFAMGRTILGSVTPHILVSIVLYIWVVFLALASVKDRLPKKNTLDFIAWYGIIFVSIDLISKLFWIIMSFLTSTFA